MKKYSSLEEVKAYFENTSIDQSRLKRLIIGLSSFLDERESKLYFVEKESFVIGSLVDSLLTHEIADFDKLYHVSTLVSKPSETLMSIVNYVYDRAFEEYQNIPEVFKTKGIDDFPELVREAVDVHNYYASWRLDTRIAKVMEQREYFEDLKASIGKQVISAEEWNLAQNIVESLKTLPILKACVTDSIQGCDIYFQYPAYFKYDGVDCKGLIDILVVDTVHKSAWVIDVKTTAERTLNFYTSVMKYRYDIQLAFYRKAIKVIFGEDYVVNCMFMVESTTRLGEPLQYFCNTEFITQAEEGRGDIIVNGVVVKKALEGFKQLILEYKYYEKTSFQKDILYEKYKNNRFVLGIEGITEP